MRGNKSEAYKGGDICLSHTCSLFGFVLTKATTASLNKSTIPGGLIRKELQLRQVKTKKTRHRNVFQVFSFDFLIRDMCSKVDYFKGVMYHFTINIQPTLYCVLSSFLWRQNTAKLQKLHITRAQTFPAQNLGISELL